MGKRDTGTDDPRVKVRPGRGSRPRTKIRPDYSSRPLGTVKAVDRGRYTVVMESGTEVMAVKARELGRGAIVVGDRVRVTGDISGAKDTLARIVLIEERSSQLTRSTEEGDGRERTIVANADIMAIVVALAQPEPKTGMIDRCLVAASDAGMRPIIVMTKHDLGSDDALRAHYEPLGIRMFTLAFEGEGADENATRGANKGADVSALTHGCATVVEKTEEQRLELEAELSGKTTVLIGHSGVGKSTLLNHLVPEADRLTGSVNATTGKGRHTSVSAVSFTLPGGGRLIDTPGVRSFGLAHVDAQGILHGFSELEEITEECPRGCTHEEGELECELDSPQVQGISRLRERAASFRRLLNERSLEEWEK
ncbi:ribosome small subunit-dependent GTPase A [Actinotignum urinale]|uniref:Small ribosomal subunit biogenesis GTPase RsgA n=1 Tax=Actinotignum urinale TaxID=190146 RepID=A0AAW9HXR3_9ACTO|nr:ribosome small subunit-dependent GTPase A [Actinotignum urinale]MDY5129415.1 ribosome small subunit-dependent GTPase A [Actinotignum urinale]MDY5155230.1 ribosome small subunit-dependent GTPase A [Actinotignum urinale]MDY5161064.1 ribosome small subunit-dependent GTPase A [Actinotignum urinale]